MAKRARNRRADASLHQSAPFKLASRAVLGAALFAPAAAAATITVETTADTINSTDGLCSLREALLNANDPMGAESTGGNCEAGSPGFDQILFAPTVTGTITLGGTHLPVADSVDIVGPGSLNLTINANNLSRV